LTVAASQTALSRALIEDEVYGALKEIIGYRPEATTDLTELLDSLQGLELLIELEDRFRIEIDEPLDDSGDQSVEGDSPAVWWVTPASILGYVAERIGETRGGTALSDAVPAGAPLTSISDTARWVAFHRALESERADALFRDPFARTLAGPEGEEIARTLRRGRDSWTPVVRTRVIDDFLQQVLANGVDAVVNLGAGLDARPYRLELPPQLIWFEVDLPDIVSYKEAKLATARPRCRLERIACNLTNPASRKAVIERIGGATSRAVVVTEGVLLYLEPDTVGELARELVEQPSLCYWICDLAAPPVLHWSRRQWGQELERAGAEMRFAPADSVEFFRPHGWRSLAFRAYWKEAQSLGREPEWLRLVRDFGSFLPSDQESEWAKGGCALMAPLGDSARLGESKGAG
jgi:methyltransferase (TIGR00027 family)